jgi:hypothetical protein
MQRQYEIQLEGSDIELRGDSFGNPEATIRGFFVNRVVRAADSSDAVQKATAAVRREWSSGQFARYSAKPRLSVAKVQALGFWNGLTARNSGYIFHPGE